jgi:hypothetical protein
VGYFFGPLRQEIPGPEEIGDYEPGDAVMVARFLEDALVSGRWPFITTTAAWAKRMADA